MKRRKKLIVAICLALAILMIAALILPVLSTFVANAASDALKSKLADLKSQASELANQQAELKKQISA